MMMMMKPSGKVGFAVILAVVLILMYSSFCTYLLAQEGSVNTRPAVLTAILSETQTDWEGIMSAAERRLEGRHPNLDVQVQYEVLPYEDMKDRISDAISNKTLIDIISMDQIWLGEFAEKGYLTDLTNLTRDWGRSSEWYETNWGGGIYNNRVFGIWAWTDVRGIWYWKDLLDVANVNPESLKTWDGYITAGKRLNEILRPQGIEGVHLVGAGHSPDLWYPYVWMLGGDILERRSNHPSRGSYWFPAFNNTEGVMAAEFLRKQIEGGIIPQKEHYWGQEFADRSFAVMIEGSWLPREFPQEQRTDFKQNIGFLPMFPVPHENNITSTMMGGWELGIPITSNNKTLAWEFLTYMVDPEILTPMLQQNGYLPTQLPIGEGAFSARMNQSIPYYQEMVSLIPLGHKRPNIPEYPLIADNIQLAIDKIYRGEEDPKQALDDAATKSAEILGW
jgi:multiple sugar transport system substrate-binding protein